MPIAGGDGGGNGNGAAAPAPVPAAAPAPERSTAAASPGPAIPNFALGMGRAGRALQAFAAIKVEYEAAWKASLSASPPLLTAPRTHTPSPAYRYFDVLQAQGTATAPRSPHTLALPLSFHSVYLSADSEAPVPYPL